MAPLADTRLVSLASSVARDAVASPRLDLYPRGLGLPKALRISQAAAGVRRDRGITVDDLMARVQAWFPDLAALHPAPTHVRMEEALHDAGFQLEYDTASRRFTPPAPTGQRPSSSTGTGLYSSGLAGPVVVGRTPADQLAAKLVSAVEQGGFLALTLDQRQLPGTAQLLAVSYPVVPIDVAAEFLAQFRNLAAEHDTDWGKVLRADERLTRTGQIPTGLRSYLNRLWPRLEQAIVDRAASAKSVLFLHNAGLLARYFDGGGQELLAGLQNAARRPADRPHGLWLLCPSEAPRSSPNLDGHTVEVVDQSEWAVLERKFLDRLREQSPAA